MSEMRCNALLISHHFRVLRSVCVRYTRVITIQSWVTQPDADGEKECPQYRCSCDCRKRFVEHLNEFTSESGRFLLPFHPLLPRPAAGAVQLLAVGSRARDEHELFRLPVRL